MPKVVTGTALEKAFEVAENPVWGTAYYRKRHVTRISKRVKAINVCLKARAIMGEPLPAQIAKEMGEWKLGGAGRRRALSAAFKKVLSECKSKARTYCEAAASTMGLSVDECASLLSGINVS
jgi:hypothetical protein